MGSTRLEMVQLLELNQIVDGIYMMFRDYSRGALDKDTMITKGIQPRLKQLDTLLGSKTYFLNKVNLLEIYTNYMMQLCKCVDEGCLKGLDNLSRMSQAVEAIDQIKAYKASNRYQPVSDVKQKGFMDIDVGIDTL